MSSFVRFRNNSLMIWNSTFKVLLNELEKRSDEHETIRIVFENNPIAGPVGGLDLSFLRDKELRFMVQFFENIKETGEEITKKMKSENAEQFLADLNRLIESANQALQRTSR